MRFSHVSIQLFHMSKKSNLFSNPKRPHYPNKRSTMATFHERPRGKNKRSRAIRFGSDKMDVFVHVHSRQARTVINQGRRTRSCYRSEIPLVRRAQHAFRPHPSEIQRAVDVLSRVAFDKHEVGSEALLDLAPIGEVEPLRYRECGRSQGLGWAEAAGVDEQRHFLVQRQSVTCSYGWSSCVGSTVGFCQHP